MLEEKLKPDSKRHAPKRTSVSPTQRSLRYLKDQGWHCWKVETYNPFSRTRQDLFNCWDILAVRGPDTLVVQSSTLSGARAREKKIAESEYTERLREAGWLLHVHGWRPLKRRLKNGKYGQRIYYEVEVIDVS